jgi:phage baseplate assembly protein W
MPFSMSSGSFSTIEQDTPEEIEQCVQAVCKTLVGSRIDVVGYGVPDQTFSTQTSPAIPTAFLAAVEAAEPRSQLLGSVELEGMVRRIVLRLGAAA